MARLLIMLPFLALLACAGADEGPTPDPMADAAIDGEVVAPDAAPAVDDGAPPPGDAGTR